jgi:hypothetical protein
MNDSAILISSRSLQESHSFLRWWAPDLERGRDASGDVGGFRLGRQPDDHVIEILNRSHRGSPG